MKIWHIVGVIYFGGTLAGLVFVVVGSGWVIGGGIVAFLAFISLMGGLQARYIERVARRSREESGGEDGTRARRNFDLAGRIVSMAVLLAGERRNMGVPWRSDLGRDPVTGRMPSARERRAHAFGHFVSGVKMRTEDVVDWTMRPVDWMLRKQSRRDAFRATVIGSHAIYIEVTDGLHSLLTLGLAWLGASYLIVTGALAWAGKRRGIELASDDEPSEN